MEYACCFQLWWDNRGDFDGGGDGHDRGFRDGNNTYGGTNGKK